MVNKKSVDFCYQPKGEGKVYKITFKTVENLDECIAALFEARKLLIKRLAEAEAEEKANAPKATHVDHREAGVENADLAAALREYIALKLSLCDDEASAYMLATTIDHLVKGLK